MIRVASRDDLAAIQTLLATANDAPYDAAAVAGEKCFDRGVSGVPEVKLFERDGQVAGLAVRCGRFLRLLAVARANRREGVGSELLLDAEANGARIIAAEPGNYFTPGVPFQDSGSITFLVARGYAETWTTHNLSVELGAFEQPEGVRRATWADRDSLLQFIEREFGRVWRFESTSGFDHAIPTLFLTEEDGAITGFSAHEANNRGLGFFGPTGVAASMRNRGLGRKLLLASLADLQRLGFAKAVIPWTDALDFYRKSCGAVPAHRFVAFGKTGS